MFASSLNLQLQEQVYQELKYLLELLPELKTQLSTLYQKYQNGELEASVLIKQAGYLLKKVNLSSNQIKHFLSLFETNKQETMVIHTPSELPDPSLIQEIREPWVKAELVFPEEMLGKVIELVTSRRGTYTNVFALSKGQLQLAAELPLAEMIIDFYDELKSLTKGYGTLSYEVSDYRPSDLVKIDILVNRQKVDPLSFLTHRSHSENKAREVCAKLKELIPRQQIEIVIQAAIGSRIVARETIKPFRKDVTAKLYGGDMTRRKKLLEKQKKGKKRMKMVGNVQIPQAAFLNILKK